MKKTYLILIIFLLFSCASNNIEKQVINDFIKEQYILDPYIKVVLDEANSRIQPLEYYEKAYQDRNIRLGDYIRVQPNGYPPYIWPIDTIEIKQLKEKYKNDTITYYWKKKDFHKAKFKIVNIQEVLSTKSSINKKYFSSAGLTFSKPIITTNSKHALLFYSTFNVGLGGTSGKHEAILMEKIDGKWKTIKTYYDPNIFN